MERKNKKIFERMSPEKRRGINVALVIIIAIITFFLLFYIAIPNIKNNQSFQNMANAEIIASIAVIVTIVLASINIIINSMNKRYSTKKQVSLAVNVLSDSVVITSTIQNPGSNRITPKCFFLFINEGIQSDAGDTKTTKYDFPNILVHQNGEFDCSLSILCKSGQNINKLPENLLGQQFEKTTQVCYKLHHISDLSVNYIDPGESFSEDAIFKLPPGVYRVILVGTSIEADCMCAHKIFVIDEEKEK